MSQCIGLILPDELNDVVDEVKMKFGYGIHNREFTDSFKRALNQDEHVYYWGIVGQSDGFLSYNQCQRIKKEKITIEERDDRYKEIFFRDYYPLIELHQKNARKWVDIIQTFLNEYGIKRLGIVIFMWLDDNTDGNDFAMFPTDVMKLDDLNAEDIMKFEQNIIHYIVKEHLEHIY